MNHAHAVQAEQISDRELLFPGKANQVPDGMWTLKDGNLNYELLLNVEIVDVKAYKERKAPETPKMREARKVREASEMYIKLTFQFCWYEDGSDNDPVTDPTLHCVRYIYNLTALFDYLKLVTDLNFFSTLISGTREERIEIIHSALTASFIMKNVRVVVRNGKIDLVSFDGFKHMSLTY